MSATIIKYRLLKNVSTHHFFPEHIGGAKVHKVWSQPTPLGEVLLTSFAVGENSPIHEVRLESEHPAEITSTGNKRFDDRLRDEEIERAIKAREHNKEVRAYFDAYVKNGTFEFISEEQVP